MWPAEKPRPIHYICKTPFNRFDQFAILLGVVLQISVLNNHNLPSSRTEARSDCSSLPAILALDDDPEFVLVVRLSFKSFSRRCRTLFVFVGKLLQDLSSPVGRAIIDDDYFLFDPDLENSSQDFFDGI